MTMTRRVAAALASSRALLAIGVLAAAISCAGFLGIGDTGHHITAQFTDANGLVTGNDVRVGGAPVGTVSSVDIEINQQSGAQVAQVVMSVDDAHWPLHQGTTAAIKPKGVLSDVYVQLQPGSSNNPSLGDSPFLSAARTQSPVNLDELTNVFTPSVREAIRTQLQEGVLAFGGAGADDLNQTLVYANPLTLDAITVTDVLATRSPQLDNLNFEFDTITGDLSREDANLRPLIVNLDTTMAAVASQEAALQGTIVHAGNVFNDLSQVLANPTTAADLTRIMQIGPQTVSCAGAMAGYLTPLITAVNPYISYSGALSLDQLLADFVTATGYNIGTTNGVPTLRANQSLPPTGFAANDAGGLSVQHLGYHNASTGGGTNNVYEEQPALTTYPTLNGCAAPPGLP